ncbi:hypothetical protein D3M83_06835 [Rodentibacter pneumotropicus]|nr:hypothetical protein D3M83_06835 [Rodentibacter pneumotropicus]
MKPDSIVYRDFHQRYDVLNMRKFNHFRINYNIQFVENRINTFWLQAKQHLQKFKGILKAHFECM